MAAGQGGFDPALLPAESVQRGINLFGGDPAETEDRSQEWLAVVGSRARAVATLAAGAKAQARRPLPRPNPIEPDAAGAFQRRPNLAARLRLLDRAPSAGPCYRRAMPVVTPPRPIRQ